MVRTEIYPEIGERCTARYTAVLTKEDGTPASAAVLESCNLTVYTDDDPQQIINNLNRVSILNDGTRGVIDTSGNLALTLQPNDNIIVISGKKKERHVLLFEWTYSGGKTGRHEAVITVKDISKVP